VLAEEGMVPSFLRDREEPDDRSPSGCPTNLNDFTLKFWAEAEYFMGDFGGSLGSFTCSKEEQRDFRDHRDLVELELVELARESLLDREDVDVDLGRHRASALAVLHSGRIGALRSDVASIPRDLLA